MKKERQPQQWKRSFLILLFLHSPWLAGNIFNARAMSLKSAVHSTDFRALFDMSSWFLVLGSWLALRSLHIPTKN
jgi:hypothetical protein